MIEYSRAMIVFAQNPANANLLSQPFNQEFLDRHFFPSLTSASAPVTPPLTDAGTQAAVTIEPLQVQTTTQTGTQTNPRTDPAQASEAQVVTPAATPPTLPAPLNTALTNFLTGVAKFRIGSACKRYGNNSHV
jgi:hypothetical protein